MLYSVACVWGPRLRKRFPAGAQHAALPTISLFLLGLYRGKEKKKMRIKKEGRKKMEYGPLRTCIKITAIGRQAV